MSKIDPFTSRRDFLRTSAVAAAGLGCLSLGFGLNAQPLTQNQPKKPEEDAANTHNMMVVGVNTVYLSHLPMFDEVNAEGTEFTSPHRRQVILEATFTQNGKPLTPLYAQNRLAHPKTKMYTLKPAETILRI